MRCVSFVTGRVLNPKVLRRRFFGIPNRSLMAAIACLAVSSESRAQFAAPEQPAASQGGGSGSAFKPTTEMIENGGIGVRVMFVGRNADGKTLTVSSEIKNLSDEAKYIALTGPQPAAIDTSGVTYSLLSHSGLGACKNLANEYIQYCAQNSSGYLPGSFFSLLQPGASSIVALTFQGPQVSESGFLSLTMNVAVGAGSRPIDGKQRKLENVAISFPLVALEKK